MFKGEYMSMETAFELASLKKENTELKNIIKDIITNINIASNKYICILGAKKFFNILFK